MFGRVFLWLEVTLLLVGVYGCEKERLGAPLPGHAFQFPTGIGIHPSGFALVASSNFDLTYKNGSLRVIDLNQLALRLKNNNDVIDNGNYFTDLILDDWAVSLDNFAGRVAVSSDGKLAAVAIRETNQLVLLDLNVNTSGQLELDCSQPKDDGSFPFCSGDRHVVTLDKTALQFDPFDVVLADQPSTVHRTAYVSFLLSGTVSWVDIPDRGDTSSPTPSLGPATGEAGINDLAYSPKSNYIYLSSHGTTTTTITNKIFSFDTTSSDPTAFNTTDLYPLLLGTETRGLAFTGDESALAVAVLNPNMLVFLDTNNNNAYLGSIELGKNPTLVYQHNDLFFVTCAQENTVYIIDGKTQRLLQVREDICNGPFDVGFFDSGDIHWALFTCFEDDTVTVLDVDPNSEFKVLAQVGKPRS